MDIDHYCSTDDLAMPNTFWKRCSIFELATLDLVPGIEMGLRHGMLITRLYVPPHHRRKGIATRLLNRCIAQAEKYGQWLYLEIVPSTGGMNYEQLKAWYEKHDFKEMHMGGVWVRRSKTVEFKK